MIARRLRPSLSGPARLVRSAVLCSLLSACTPSPQPLPTGTWSGVLHLQPGVILPFTFELAEARLWLIDGETRLGSDSLRYAGDSVFVRLGVFDTELRAQVQAQGSLHGHWYDYNRSRGYRIPFEAQPGAPLPTAIPAVADSLPPRWRVTFSPGERSAYPAIGLFEAQPDGHLAGTFLTETGDYRYLRGRYRSDSLWLAAFDGSHAFAFAARRIGPDSLQGAFFSGTHWQEAWTARADPAAALRAPEALTFLKPGYDGLAFSLPDTSGTLVSLSDPRFAGKVVIVQLLGTWCPNCMDETRLLARWYRQYHAQGLEIVGLAFENGGDPQRAWPRIERMRQHLGAEYPILLAATQTDKESAAQLLPMLNHVMSYPTSIFIDRQGSIRRIHTGFSGPGTGVVYERFVQEYEALLTDWLAERPAKD